MHYAFCNSKDCEYFQEFGPTYELDGITEKVDPAPKFCPRCGSKMVEKCLDCGTFQESPEGKFCSNCGKSLKLL